MSIHGIFIKVPTAAFALVNALVSSSAGVRRLAAETLIVLAREGIESLLHGLIGHKYSEWLRQGVHHGLHQPGERREFEPAATVVFGRGRSVSPSRGIAQGWTSCPDALRKSDKRLHTQLNTIKSGELNRAKIWEYAKL